VEKPRVTEVRNQSFFLALTLPTERTLGAGGSFCVETFCGSGRLGAAVFETDADDVLCTAVPVADEVVAGADACAAGA